MRATSPRVHLIAEPAIDWTSIKEYLEEIGGESWFYRASNQFISDENADESQTLVEFSGRLCYRSWEPGLNPNVTKVREQQDAYLDNILKVGHGSVLEHANFSFIFENVSRVFTHELVRHRAGAAYSQESMRFVRLDDIPFWFPDWAQGDAELMSRALKLLSQMEEFQLWMADHFGLDDDGVPFSEKKHKTSFMRRFAPDGVSTSIVATFNARALRHVIFMRTAKSAEEEIRLVFDDVANLMREKAPYLFQDFTRNDDGEWVTPYIKV